MPSPLANTTAFLYTGSNPVQTGVAAGVIEAKRAAVVRGKVLTRDGTPLPGVTVQVLNHPEYGKTVSRADGVFSRIRQVTRSVSSATDRGADRCGHRLVVSPLRQSDAG